MDGTRVSRHWWEGDSGRLQFLCAAVYSVVLLAIVGYAQVRPVNNWDMLAYVGIARSVAIHDPTALHEEVYRLAESSVDETDYDALTASGAERTSSAPFLAETAASPRAFAQQLPFYLVKPVYPLLIAAAAGIGMDPFDASVLIASLAYVGFGVVVLLWLRRHHPPLIATALATLLVISPPFMILARLSTPDSISLLLVTGSAYALASHRAAALALGLALLAVLARPNAAVWAVLLSAYLLIWAPRAFRPPRWVPVVTAVAAVGLYLGLTRWAGYYPFPTLFHHSLIEYLPYPADFRSTLGPADYLRQYVHELLAFQYGSALIFLMLGAIVLVARRDAGGPSRDILTGLVLLAFLAAAMQWIVFPAEPERILVGQLAVIAIGLAITSGSRVVPQSSGTGSS